MLHHRYINIQVPNGLETPVNYFPILDMVPGNLLKCTDWCCLDFSHLFVG